MKSKITVEQLKELVQEFIALEDDKEMDSGEWAYVMLEPMLIANEEVTLNYLKQINEEEFRALGENHWFEDILCKFRSVEILDVIRTQYFRFFGEDTTTEFYLDSIEGLQNCIKK